MISNISCDLTRFEAAASEIGVVMRAAQLDRGDAQVHYSYKLMGHGVLCGYDSSSALAVEWQTRPESINFSVRAGGCGLMLEGHEREAYSLVMYVEPGCSSWAGKVIAAPSFSSSRPSYHMSIPLRGGSILGIPGHILRRGWIQIDLEERQSLSFCDWAQRELGNESKEPAQNQDQLYWWIQEMFAPVLRLESATRSPSHYVRLIHAINNLTDETPHEALAVTDLAERLNVSVRTLQRAFRSTFGIGVSQYLRNRRLKRAHDVLRTGRGTVHRIAYDNGFHHVPRFSQQYRALFGINPSETLHGR